MKISDIREKIQSLYYLRDMLTGGTSEEFARQNVGPDLAARIVEVEALEIPARFKADIEERRQQIEYAQKVIARWEGARAALLEKLSVTFTSYGFATLVAQPQSEKLSEAVQSDRLLARCYEEARREWPAATTGQTSTEVAQPSNVVAFVNDAPAAPATAPAKPGHPFFEMPILTAGGDWTTYGAAIPVVAAEVRGHSVQIMKTVYGSGEEARANAKAATGTGDLLRLAVRIANLNPDAGEIGAGMLAQLIDAAREACRKAGARETPALA